jgi:DNA repair exonuclease SbcCD ATPase subunit
MPTPAQNTRTEHPDMTSLRVDIARLEERLGAYNEAQNKALETQGGLIREQANAIREIGNMLRQLGETLRANQDENRAATQEVMRQVDDLRERLECLDNDYQRHKMAHDEAQKAHRAEESKRQQFVFEQQITLKNGLIMAGFVALMGVIATIGGKLAEFVMSLIGIK